MRDADAARKWQIVVDIIKGDITEPGVKQYWEAIHDQILAWKEKQSFVGPYRISLNDDKYLMADCDSGWNLYGVYDNKEIFIRHLNEFENSFINSAIAQVVENATHIQIPPPFHGQGLTDVIFAEGWNQACLNFFCNNQPPEPIIMTIEHTVEDTVSIQDAWVWAGGNPEIKATKDELRFALETLDQIAEEADDSRNPLLVFAKEILIGAYKPEELSGVAMQAIKRFKEMK